MNKHKSIMNYIGITLICFIFIITYIAAYAQGTRRCQISQLRGFWESPKQFNDEADLSMFSMYIGKEKGGVYPCYFLMIDNDDTLLINEASCFTLKEPLSNLTTREDCREFYAKFDCMENELLPENLKIKFYPQTNKIIFADDETIYSVFYKNPLLSELERISKETPEANGIQEFIEDDDDNDDQLQ